MLLSLTLAAQLSSLAYTIDGSFLPALAPSVLVLCVVTIPLATLGLILGQNVGLGAPLLTDLLNRKPGSGKQLFLDARLALCLGLGLGALLVLIRYVHQPFLPPEMPELGHRGPLGGLLVSIGAAIGEEVWLRLGVMTILARALVYLYRRDDVDAAIGWSAIVISAIAFGAIHLPQLASYEAASPVGIVATVLGNTLVGLLFGWLYWRRSLIAAMIGHFAVDIVLHVLTAFRT
ncbi:CPBP family intramembrane glutamic endopeptidase [Pseudobythopirellula maris]|uniref:CPBP family intramembrane glutamic endopeptidase n=1 Tax=Pseudobythopirellula maris TaxID=2527991 RepID=UPI0018D34C89|nr:CPBP family intramembrane glutamic endopeptidase [Pseudobythopirellula maris]